MIASLANYFGERPLDIVMFDADSERLDLFDRFARLTFSAMNSTHHLRSTDDLTPGQQTFLVTSNLPAVAADLERGAVVVLGRRRIRVRDLPIGES